MGILDSFRNNKVDLTRKTTKGFYIGSPEAEAENNTGIQNLEHYFDDFLEVLPLLSKGKFLIVGRKGAGKSAIAKFIKDSSDKTDNSYCDLIRINNVSLEKIIQNTHYNEDVTNKESALFEWLILVRLAKLLVQNKNAQYTLEYKKISDFLTRNAGIVDIDKYQIEEVYEKKGGQVSFDVLRHSFKGIISKYFDIKTTQAPFYKLITPLKEIIKTVLKYDVHTNVEYLLLFDDLDINFSEKNFSDIHTLVQLIRIAKQYNNEIFTNSKAKIIIFLRDDIKHIVLNHYADTAKIFSSYEILLSWYDHENFKTNENSTNLKKFINKRIELNFKANNILFFEADPWTTLVVNSHYNYSDKSAFKYILDYTFYRPRDLILFFNNIGKEDYEYPLSPYVIQSMLNKLTVEIVAEIKNELSVFFDSDQIQGLMSVFQYFSKDLTISYDRFINKLKPIECEKNSAQIFEILLKYSLVIPKDMQGRLFFNYREKFSYESFNKSDYNYGIHKALMQYFNQT